MNLFSLKIGAKNYAVNGSMLAKIAELGDKGEDRDLELLLGYLRAKGKGEEDFPLAKGDVSGTNGLWRVHWFNGRFLTAEALRSQDIYWDLRARFLGRVHPPGVVFGMDISLAGYSPRYVAPALAEGAAADSEVRLGEGLGFDGLGRPIVVGKAFHFPFRHLLERWRARPLRVSPAGTRFMGCVCLEDDATAGDPGPAIRAGTYLILIRPEEQREGSAKVYGELCPDGKGGGCEADGFRGGFGLFLARLPVDIASAPDLRSPWDVRGTLSAWYFDVFEHSLIRRWDPPFAADSRFCSSPRETGRDEAAVPLALVHVGSDGSICAFDAWIPRRAVTATQGSTWSQVLIGHSPPAAAYARLHQFQCMLHQSLERRAFSGAPGEATTVDIRGVSVETITLRPANRPVMLVQLSEGAEHAAPGMELLADVPVPAADGTTGTFTFRIRLISPVAGTPGRWRASTDEGTTLHRDTMVIPANTPVRGLATVAARRRHMSLYDRGFRHIPPMGFLPFDASTFDWAAERDDRRSPLDPIFFLGPVSRLVWAADRMAEAYFAGTNVVTYTVVAVHDDDMLEDWNNVHTKDPIQLRPMAPRREVPAGAADPGKDVKATKVDTHSLFTNYSPVASAAQPLAVFGLFFGQLRAGFEGLGSLANRQIEIVKIMVPLQGTARMFPVEGPVPEDFRSTFDAWLAGKGADLAKLYETGGMVAPPPALPRHFVAYVKQRIVLLDMLYAMLELVSMLFQGLGDSKAALSEVPTGALKQRVKNFDPKRAAMAKAVADQPFAREILVQSALHASPNLRHAEDWNDYWSRVDVLEKSFGNAAGARSLAMASAADELAVDNDGFGIVKLLLAIDDTPAVEGSLKAIHEAVRRDPLRDAAGNPLGRSLSRQVFRTEETKGFANDAQAAAYAAGKSALTGKTVREATGVESDATVADVLAAAPDKAAELLGGEAHLKVFTQKLRGEAQKVARTVEGLRAPDAALAKDYGDALEKAGGDAEKAMAGLARKYSGNAGRTEDIRKLKSLHKTVGAEGLARVAGAYFRKPSG